MAATESEAGEVAGGGNATLSRQEIEAAMAKAVELRALHASLMQGKSCPSAASPLSRHASYFSAHDYPVFTPVSISFYFILFISFYLFFFIFSTLIVSK